MTAQPKQSSLDRPKSGAGKAILAYAPSRVIEPVLGLISLPILTRTLGVDEYGIFSIVFITATLMRTILFDWVSNCALRFRTAMLGAKDDFFTNLLLGTAFSFSMAAAIFLIIKGTAAPDSLKVVFAFFGFSQQDTGVGDVARQPARIGFIDPDQVSQKGLFGLILRSRRVRGGELEGEGGHFDWRGHSDTETLLAVLRHWGVEGGLQRLNGMFSFALWDKVERTLFLAAHDRLNYEGVVRILDLAKSGVEGLRIGIVTENRQ